MLNIFNIYIFKWLEILVYKTLIRSHTYLLRFNNCAVKCQVLNFIIRPENLLLIRSGSIRSLPSNLLGLDKLQLVGCWTRV